MKTSNAITSDPKSKYPTASFTATKRLAAGLVSKGGPFVRPPRKSAGFKWRDVLAREIGWRIWDSLHPIILQGSNPKKIKRVLDRQVRGLLNGPFGDELVTAATRMTDPIKMLLNLLKRFKPRERTTTDRLMLRAVVRDYLHDNKRAPHDLRLLEDVCLEILGVIPCESGTAVASWPSFLKARLKSKRFQPVKGHINPTPTKESILAFFETNPYSAPSIQVALRAWLWPGSRCQTFRAGCGQVSAPDQILVELYPEEHAFWMSCNLVALRNDIYQLRQQWRCIDKMLRLRAFLDFGYDPELQFAPNETHNLLGLVCTTEERANTSETDTFLEKLRRALGRFDAGLYCEEEAVDAINAGGDDVPAGQNAPARRRSVAIRARLAAFEERRRIGITQTD